MNDFGNALKAGGATGIGVVLLWSLARDIIVKSSPLSSELTFVLIAGILFFIFILGFKMMSSPKVSRDSSVSIGEGGYNLGEINTGDTNSSKREDYRDSSVSVNGENRGDIRTGDSNTNN